VKRPLSIVWFERFYVVGILLPTIFLIATWKETMNADGDDGAAIVSIALIFIGFTYVASFLFWYFIMRRRSRVARWVLAILTVLAAPLSFIDPNGRAWDVWGVVEAAGVVVSLVAVICLFMPDARSWFDGTPDDLAETFS
jgi:hypothetical protein